MPTALIIMIVVIVIAVVIAGTKSFNTSKRLAEDGKIAPRQGAFYEEAELFTTTATYEGICEKIKSVDLSDTKASIQYDFEGQKTIFFKSNDGWNAALDWIGEEDGKNRFRFYFPAWRVSRNGIVNTMSMNVALTAIEKAILALDPTATVESRKLQTKRQ